MIACLVFCYCPEGKGDLGFLSTRAQAMGGALIASVDDEAAIFHNPAGLAGSKKVSFQLLNLELEASEAFFKKSLNHWKNLFENFPVKSVDALMGENFSLRGQGMSSLLLPSCGAAFLVDEELAFRIQDSVFPQSYLKEQRTYGVQFAVGQTVWKASRRRGALKLGVAGKILWRSGGEMQPHVEDILSLDVSGLRKKLAPLGIGYGLDFGLQGFYRIQKHFRIQLASVVTDLGDTAFVSGALSQKSRLRFGTALIYQAKYWGTTFAYDLWDPFSGQDWRKKNHLGLELKILSMSFFGGISQVYPTYGFGFQFGLIQLAYASSAEELGTFVNQNPERKHRIRFALQLNL